jgi:hypothetical protein
MSDEIKKTLNLAEAANAVTSGKTVSEKIDFGSPGEERDFSRGLDMLSKEIKDPRVKRYGGREGEKMLKDLHKAAKAHDMKKAGDIYDAIGKMDDRLHNHVPQILVDLMDSVDHGGSKVVSEQKYLPSQKNTRGTANPYNRPPRPRPTTRPRNPFTDRPFMTPSNTSGTAPLQPEIKPIEMPRKPLANIGNGVYLWPGPPPFYGDENGNPVPVDPSMFRDYPNVPQG